MALAQDDIEQIQNIVQQAINNSPELKNSNVRYELDLRERTIRVEEELKHQRELMIQGFAQMDKRFEQVEKRFQQNQEEMNKRFEQVDKRFEQMDKQFTEMGRRLDRFMFWSLGITISSAIFVVNYLK
ncbi:MAG: hypothetical protein IBX55_23265 [Methyloprofundus sp.]|nr:hypothetical protein [Methyloprofundus sp.]MBW6454172.1 hypothetical protein [Methyloprofundus sp.]